MNALTFDQDIKHFTPYPRGTSKYLVVLQKHAMYFLNPTGQTTCILSGIYYVAPTSCQFAFYNCQEPWGMTVPFSVRMHLNARCMLTLTAAMTVPTTSSRRKVCQHSVASQLIMDELALDGNPQMSVRHVFGYY